jgi:hypothetical protein
MKIIATTLLTLALSAGIAPSFAGDAEDAAQAQLQQQQAEKAQYMQEQADRIACRLHNQKVRKNIRQAKAHTKGNVFEFKTKSYTILNCC